MSVAQWRIRLWRELQQLRAAPNLDVPLLSVLMAVAAGGLAVLYSASGESLGLVINQALRLAVGCAALLVLARLSPSTLRWWSPWAYLVSLGLLVLVLYVGEGRGARRWLDLGVAGFQPSELAKLTLPMIVAWLLHYRPLPPDWMSLASAAVLIGVPTALIVVQPDLGTAVLVATSGLFALFLAGLRWRIIVSLTAAAVAAAIPAWQFLHDYQKDRIRTFLSPEAEPLGDGWNIIQSKIAVGSGGLYGKGWQSGTQSHLEFLPERSTDFILAVHAEELGFFGVVVLLGAYLFIVGRGLLIAAQARDKYSRLLAGSLSLTFAVYVVVNAAMVSGLLPVVGVPLPLVSYGGTSMVTLLAGFGMLMSIHSHRRFMHA